MSYELVIARRYLTGIRYRNLFEYAWKTFLKIIFFLATAPLAVVVLVYFFLRRWIQRLNTDSVPVRVIRWFLLTLTALIFLPLWLVDVAMTWLFRHRDRPRSLLEQALSVLFFVLTFPVGIILHFLRYKEKAEFSRIISYISIGGVLVGVAALLVVLSVMNGFEREVRSRIIGFDAHLRVRTFHDQGMENPREIMARIETIPGIVGMAPYVLDKAMVRSKYGAEGVVVKGINPEELAQVSNIEKTIVYGELNLSDVPPLEGDGRSYPGIVLGRYLADRLVVGLGDLVSVFSPAGWTGMPGWMPPVRVFRVAGYFETGLFDFDDTFAYISLEAAQQLFQMGKRVSGIEVKLDDLDRAEKVKGQIEKMLGYPYTAITWFDMNKNLFAWMKIEKWAAFIILNLIILVAAFNIVSTLIMVVLEKTREIGILKSMGATSGGVMRIFVMVGMLVGALGIALGCVVGFLLGWSQQKYQYFSLPPDIYIINSLPVVMRPLDFILVAVFALLLCFLATVYPAYKASRLDPVEAIRYE
jgi:lipoprotein-releasing system permease protein